MNYRLSTSSISIPTIPPTWDAGPPADCNLQQRAQWERVNKTQRPRRAHGSANRRWRSGRGAIVNIPPALIADAEPAAERRDRADVKPNCGDCHHTSPTKLHGLASRSTPFPAVPAAEAKIYRAVRQLGLRGVFVQCAKVSCCLMRLSRPTPHCGLSHDRSPGLCASIYPQPPLTDSWPDTAGSEQPLSRGAPSMH